MDVLEMGNLMLAKDRLYIQWPLEYSVEDFIEDLWQAGIQSSV